MVIRFDAPNNLRIEQDASGFLMVSGVIASLSDKLNYNGTIETIAESALFDDMEQLEGTPLTLRHPKDFVTPETAQQYQVGSVVKAWREGDELWCKIKVTAKSAIDAIRIQGMRGLSAAYDVVMNGLTQVKRIMNHVALCSVGRAQSSGIRSDSRDSFDSKTVQERFDDLFYKKPEKSPNDGLTVQQRADKAFYAQK